ncbi:MAG: NUDIX domain-containing protein [Patescibacteria group bacterium]|nr:NUDIX domain-containing protein [Patescibacteria group bacterium]
MKKRSFGVGKWNGVGGKPEGNETITSTAIREAKEEIGVNIKESDLEKVCEFKFFFKDGKNNQEVSVFLCKSWEGDIIETEEMMPQWFHIDKIPYDNMWSDDKY